MERAIKDIIIGDRELDRQISRIQLSDKTSRLHPRHVVPKPAQAYEPRNRPLWKIAIAGKRS
jgi:hypothetical protein